MEELGRFRVEYLSHDDESSYRLSRLRLENTEVCMLVVVSVFAVLEGLALL